MTAGIQELIASWAPSADLSCPAAMLQALANSSGIPLQDGFFQLMKNQFRILYADQFEADPYLAAMKDLPDQIREGRFTLAMVSYEKGELLAYDAPSGSGLSDKEAGEVLIVPNIGCFDRKVRFPAIYEEEIPWMSVCPSEMNTLREPLEDARAFLRQRKDSRVLVLGLGLGYYPFLISLEDSVKEIVIVEYSREIIDLFEKGCTVHEMEKFCNSKGYEDIYMGGFYNLKVVEIPKGTRFCIREYDGAEYIEIMEEQDWFYAED